MIAEALKADGVEEIFRLGDEDATEVDIFNDDYLAKIEKIKLPNTKAKLLQRLLARAIEDFKKTNKAKYTDWSQRDDIKAELKVDLILAMAKHGYPPVANNEVYKDILEQAENFKKYRDATQD